MVLNRKKCAKEYKNVLMISMNVITASAKVHLFFHLQKIFLKCTLQYVMMANVLIHTMKSFEYLLKSA